jgi:hypothetical protein
MLFGNLSITRDPPRAVYSSSLVRESPKVTFQTYLFRREIEYFRHYRILPQLDRRVTGFGIIRFHRLRLVVIRSANRCHQFM